jgi:hypothetical protein
MRTLTTALLLLALIACGPSGREVTRAEFGDAWPLTIERATVDCDAQGRAILKTRAPDPTGTWALTGAAQQYGYPPIDPFWRENPGIPGTRVPLTELIRLALEQCR